MPHPQRAKWNQIGPSPRHSGEMLSKGVKCFIEETLRREERSPREGLPDRSADGSSPVCACGQKLEASPLQAQQESAGLSCLSSVSLQFGIDGTETCTATR